MIRVLVVEDSATTRELITAILERVPDIQVVGQAADGLEGVELAEMLRPDVITMDINMPRLNGYEATKQIMDRVPTPIVVVTSISAQEMIHRGLDILLAGAVDIVQKPSSLDESSYQTIGEELVAKVKAAAQIRFGQPSSQ
jgi:two-component system chemotaxis response regulator CheB